MLHIRTFGGCHLERDGVRLDDISAQRKALAFLALLACAGERGVTRDTAAALLWPESGEERARASLKQMVHSLRQRLGAEAVLTSGDLRLSQECVTSDVGAFSDALRRGEREVAARTYAGPFLHGFYLRGGGAFEQWVAEQRASLAREFADAVRPLAEDASARRRSDTQVCISGSFERSSGPSRTRRLRCSWRSFVARPYRARSTRLGVTHRSRASMVRVPCSSCSRS